METEVPKWSTATTTGSATKPKTAQQGRPVKSDSTSKGALAVPVKPGRAATKTAAKGKPTKDNAKKTPDISGCGKKPNVYLTSSEEEDDFVGSPEPATNKPNNKQKKSQPSSSKHADPPESISPSSVSQTSQGNFWEVSHTSKDAKSKPETNQASQPSQSQSAVPPSLMDSEGKEKIGPENGNIDAHREAASLETKKIPVGTGDEEASEEDEAGSTATPARKAVNKNSLTASAARHAATPSTRGANIGGLTKGRLRGSIGGFMRVLHPNATSDGSLGNVPITPTMTATKAYKPAGLSRSSRKSSAGVLPPS